MIVATRVPVRVFAGVIYGERKSERASWVTKTRIIPKLGKQGWGEATCAVLDVNDQNKTNTHTHTYKHVNLHTYMHVYTWTFVKRSRDQCVKMIADVDQAEAQIMLGL